MPNKMTEAIPDRLRIVVVEDRELIRAGLCSLLSRNDDFEVAGNAANWQQAMLLVQQEKPDVVLYSLNEDGSNTEFLPELLAVSESTRILALTDSQDQEVLRRAVRQGAAGVLSKDKPPTVLAKAIRCINSGESWLDRITTASLLLELSPRNRSRQKDPEAEKIAALTEREREVIRLVGMGLKNKEIAEKLFISSVTVHHHLTSIYSKLEVADRPELLIFSYRNGLAQLPG